jgi:hypothetical protein
MKIAHTILERSDQIAAVKPKEAKVASTSVLRVNLQAPQHR